MFSPNFEYSQFPRVLTDITVFYIIVYNIGQISGIRFWIYKERRENFRVDIELYQHGFWPISLKNLQMLYYKSDCNFN